jgi:hypothetical protein
MCAFPFRCKIDQILQILDCAIYKDAFGIVAWCVSWEEGIGTCCEDEDIVGDCFSGRAGNEFLFGVYLGDSCVEVIVQRAFRTIRVLHYQLVELH